MEAGEGKGRDETMRRHDGRGVEERQDKAEKWEEKESGREEEKMKERRGESETRRDLISGRSRLVGEKHTFRNIIFD